MQVKHINDFVNINETNSRVDIHLGLFYSNNEFCEENLYKENIAFLHFQTARKLEIASEIAQKHNLKLRIYDAYRPYSITKKLNQLFPNLEDGLLADNNGSWHNVGRAVDITLIDENKKELNMPTRPQELTEKASMQNDNSILLKKIMNEAGFVSYAKEWWHFFDFFDEDGNRIHLANLELYDFERERFNFCVNGNNFQQESDYQ